MRTKILLRLPVSIRGGLLVFTLPRMDFMLSCAAGFQNSTAGRILKLKNNIQFLLLARRINRACDGEVVEITSSKVA